MKLLHTSDWHLGKKLYRLERLPEQERFLDELLALIKTEQVDHLLVAGDIFDVPQPPHRALKLFYDFISRLINETKAELWLIGGNHDSGTLLDAPSALIDSMRVHLFGHLRTDYHEHWARLMFPDNKHHLDLCLLPYFRHHELAPWRENESVTENGWPELVIKRFLTTPPSEKSQGRVLLAHHLFGMYEAAGSEQALALSGLESIPLDWLSQFDYAALGHIHKPQTLKKSAPMVRYCGSPIAMRFSETAPKGVQLIEWKTDGSFSEKVLPLTTFRPLLSLKLNAENWEQELASIAPSELPSAVEIYLSLKAPVPGLLETIRSFAESKGLELLNIMPEFTADKDKIEEENWTALLKLTPEELFQSFYLSKYPQESAVPDDLALDMRALWEEARRASPPA